MYYTAAAAPTTQKLEYCETRSGLNEAGDNMLTSFPPTFIEMGVSSMQVTQVLKVYEYVLTD
jgi:hypothetical protein